MAVESTQSIFDTPETMQALKGAFSVHGEGLEMFVGGSEVIYGTDAYRHDGMRRAAITKSASFVFQYTLHGWGKFRHGKTFQEVGPQQALCAFAPARYVYTNDPRCPEWTLLWISIYGVHNLPQRLRKYPALNNTVINLSDDSPVIRRAIRAILAGNQNMHSPSPLNKLNAEEELYRFVWTLERWAMGQSHENQGKLSNFARNFTLNHLSQPFSMKDLAAASDMEYAQFANAFHRETGKPPIVFINEIRMQESVHLLRSTDLSIKQIAANTGFTTCDYFCKSFRKHFHTSPGAFRKSL